MSEKRYEYKVGANVFVVENNKLLLGKRLNARGAGDWGLPGGHLEGFESVFDAAKRELREETGLSSTQFSLINTVNTSDKSRDEHYLQIGLLATNYDGEVTLCEPEKCEEWRWFDLEELPDNIFSSHVELIKQFVSKYYE